MPTLTYRGTSLIPIEAGCVTPDNLVGKPLAEIERFPVQHGNAVVPLGEFFTVRSDPDDAVVVEGDCSRVKWLGSGMSSGTLTIYGPVGMHVGAAMSGGTLHVHGDASDWAGAELRGGLLHIHGNAGHLVGAAYRGGRVGMRGGAILVDGNASNEVGANLRRGVLAVAGDLGDFAGVGTIAGSIIVGGRLGRRAGAGMKRGTLAVFGGPPVLLPTFRLACDYRPVFLELYLRQLHAWGLRLPPLPERVRRYTGDHVAGGKGEVLDCHGGTP